MRKTAVLVTTKELELIVSLLRRHVEVAQYEEESQQKQLSLRLERMLAIAKELEPL